MHISNARIRINRRHYSISVDPPKRIAGSGRAHLMEYANLLEKAQYSSLCRIERTHWTVSSHFKEELQDFKTDKGTIRIPYGRIDDALIAKIAKWCWETGNHA